MRYHIGLHSLVEVVVGCIVHSFEEEDILGYKVVVEEDKDCNLAEAVEDIGLVLDKEPDILEREAEVEFEVLELVELQQAELAELAEQVALVVLAVQVDRKRKELEL